jgi:hypothetical protein
MRAIDTYRLPRSVVLVAVALFAVCSGAAAQPDLAELARQSNVIVGVTVVRLRAANVSGVPASDNTVVVKVGRVYDAPRSIAGFAGAEITVLSTDPGTLRVGDQLVLFARTWLAGDHIAVQEVGRLPGAGAADLPRRIAAARQGGADQDLRARLTAADVVVRGRVTAVRPATPDPARGGSEHDPFWQEAVIRVSAVLKGDSSLQEVVVLFPGSRDIAWVNAPRFRVGQKGIWILTRDAKANGLTALDPLDFQAASELARVRRLL